MDRTEATTTTAPEVTDPVSRPSVLGRLINLGIIVVPFLGFAAALWLTWGWGIGWLELSLLLGMYVITSLGLTVGFHRLFTHRSFETHPILQFIFAALGSMTAQGSLFDWVALHRRHHQYSDRPGDPHSPHAQGTGLLGMIRGFFHAHLGWMFGARVRDLRRYAADLHKSTPLCVASAMFPFWVFLGLFIPALLGGLLTLSWTGALLGLLWGGLARMCLFHHVTWSINSVCHLWGGQPHQNHDHSTNNLIFGILAFGEGWHNNHHAYPTSARHGLRWWQIDMSYWCIWTMALLGLARKVKLPVGRTEEAGVPA
jgi:stearoyl-CoA desaturase (delta-9 desaturase)